jgi:hypothetical protein
MVTGAKSISKGISQSRFVVRNRTTGFGPISSPVSALMRNESAPGATEAAEQGPSGQGIGVALCRPSEICFMRARRRDLFPAS